ncbi:MAG: tetratricopeptide repeat protein [Thermoanaerobaculia bacterium]
MNRAGVMVLMLAFAAGGCSEYNREAVDSNNQGMSLLRANRYSDAREKFQRAAEEDHRYDLPLYNLALSYIRQHDWPNAIDALDRAISRNPNNSEYHFQRGNAHYQIATATENAENSEGGAHLEQARTSFQNAIQHNQHMYMAQFRLGQVAELLDEPQAALRAYTDCIASAPRAYPAYARLGRVYMNANLFNEAAQVLREGLRVAPEGVPERGQMHNILGLTLLRQNQQVPATEEFLSAVREDPQLVQALFSLGMTYAEMPDRHPQAVLYLTQFVSARGGNAPPEYIQIAQARLGELQAAGQ